MTLATALYLIGGFALLTVGAEGLVRGASHVARRAGISSAAIGLTVVAYGTSAPEMAVSVEGALEGQVDVALGNVVGSNVFNVLAILGISAVLLPLTVVRKMVRVDVPIMIAVSVATLLLSLDRQITRVEGAILIAALVIYTTICIRSARRHHIEHAGHQHLGLSSKDPKAGPNILTSLVLVAGGLGILVVGANLFMTGALDLARALGLSELVIGLTVVAAGTSLPEIATSVIATIRGERDIAVGNVVGSNIFNLLGVLGVSAAVAPTGLTVAPSALAFDIPVMIAVAIACLPVLISGGRISRWEGLLFLAGYAAYVAYLILQARGHDALPAFSRVMMAFVLPLIAITLIAMAWPRRPGRPTA